MTLEKPELSYCFKNSKLPTLTENSFSGLTGPQNYGYTPKGAYCLEGLDIQTFFPYSSASNDITFKISESKEDPRLEFLSDDELRFYNQLFSGWKKKQFLNLLEERHLHSRTDGLTGLRNRLSLDEILQTQLDTLKRDNYPQAQKDKNLALILFDGDKFKSVNDSFGHSIGDDVLRMFGDITTDYLQRSTDIPFRYGGEEFAVVCSNTNQERGCELADGLRRRLGNICIVEDDKNGIYVKEFSPDERILPNVQVLRRLSASFGVVSYPQNLLKQEISTATPEDLIDSADLALYEAKHRGRNCVFYNHEGDLLRYLSYY